MGDAGSTLLAAVITALTRKRRGENSSISPNYCAIVIAIPLMDMVAIMYRRLPRKGMSPFFPLIITYSSFGYAAGFYFRRAFVLIALAAAILAG